MDHYDAIIIGTGFGGTVAAVTLAQQGKRILMLERGAWWFTPERPLHPWIAARSKTADPEPVQYWPRPNHTEGLASVMSVAHTNSPHAGEVIREALAGAHRVQPLYHLTASSDLATVTGSGVGGGSLVYANVNLEPYWDGEKYPLIDGWPVQLTPADYQAARGWMEAYRGKLNHVVTRIPPPAGANLADLAPSQQYLYLGKSRALKDAATGLDGAWKDKMIRPWAPLDLSLTEYTEPRPGDPRDPKKETFCERQGRCIMGCLPAARHSLNKTILNTLLAPPAGPGPKPDVTLRALAEVDYLSPGMLDGGYRVHYRDLRNDTAQEVAAPVVILAAGTLGSTRILLRTKAEGGMHFSDALGTRFSSNGDFTGFGVLPDSGPYPVFPTRGPINTSGMMFRAGDHYVTVEDGGIPAMFSKVLAAALRIVQGESPGQQEAFTATMQRSWLRGEVLDLHAFTEHLLPEASDPRSYPTEDERLARTFLFNCLGNDKANGRLSLDAAGRIAISHPDGSPGQEALYPVMEALMTQLATAMGGTYVPFPLWKGLATRKLLTVFPLGGCPMGRDAREGVVDAQGRVFDPTGGGVHEGMFVMDGSILPGPLAVQPSLTIVALALKMAQGLAERWAAGDRVPSGARSG